MAKYEIARLSGVLSYFEADKGVVVRGVHAGKGDRFELPKAEVEYLVRAKMGREISKATFDATDKPEVPAKR